MSGNDDWREPLKTDLEYLLAEACSLKHLNRREPRNPDVRCKERGCEQSISHDRQSQEAPDAVSAGLHCDVLNAPGLIWSHQKVRRTRGYAVLSISQFRTVSEADLVRTK